MQNIRPVYKINWTYFCILATNVKQEISSGICNSTKNVRYLRMNLTKHVCDLYTKNYKKKKKKKKKKTLSNSGGKNTNRQALGPPPGPHNYSKGTRCCVISGSGKTRGGRRWLLVWMLLWMLPTPQSLALARPRQLTTALELKAPRLWALWSPWQSWHPSVPALPTLHPTEQHIIQSSTMAVPWLLLGVCPPGFAALNKESSASRRTHLAPHAPPSRLNPSHSLCNPVDCSPPGSSVHGILQARRWSRLPFPSPGDLPKSGIKPGSHHFAERFFTIWATREASFPRSHWRSSPAPADAAPAAACERRCSTSSSSIHRALRRSTWQPKS